MKVAFTGHRPDKLGGYRIPNPTFNFVTRRIHEELVILRPSLVISGMALGVDQWAAEIAYDLGIPFLAAIPCEGQERMWPEESKIRYKSLLSKASDVVVVSPGKYSPYKMQVRNKWMVDSCDLLLAVWDWSEGGTANCIKYAQSLQRETKYILLRDLVEEKTK